MPDFQSPTLRGHAAMLLFSALVAGSFALGARAANLMDPAAFNAVRFLFASLIIGTLVFFGPGIKKQDLSAPWRYLVLGGLFSVYFVTMFEGLKTAAPISASAVFTLTPVLSAGFGWLLLRQVTTPRMAAALALAAGGAVWVIFRGDVDAILAFEIGRGEMIFFIGVVAHALYTPLIKLLNRGEKPLVFTLGMMVAGFILLSLYGAPSLMRTDFSSLPKIVWITLAYVTVFASATTFFLLQYAALHLKAAKVMAYTYLVPAWVIAWEIALGGPMMTAAVMVGIAAVIVALLMLLLD
ncbi:MAG: EamA family transporter [Rhodobacteraceae bacterium]|nr:EamA family transporter [Paracoccaceae bacterium]